MQKRPRAYLILILALLITTCSKSEAQKLAEAAVRGEASYKQYKTADYATAKAALFGYIDFCKKQKVTSSTEQKTYIGHNDLVRAAREIRRAARRY